MKRFRQNRHREPNSDQFDAGTTVNGPSLAEIRSPEGATPRRREGALASRVMNLKYHEGPRNNAGDLQKSVQHRESVDSGTVRHRRRVDRLAVHDMHRERLAARLRRVGGAVQGEVRGARADVRRLFEDPRCRDMLLSHGERHEREFYGTWATGLLPAKYLIWFVIYLAAAGGVERRRPFYEVPKPTSIRDPKKTNDGGREGISSDEPVRRQRLLRAEQPEADA